MKEILHALQDNRLMQSLPPQLLEDYVDSGHFRVANYSKGHILHTEGDDCNQLEVIIHGKIAVERIDESGGLLTVSTMNPGKLIGANLLFSSKPRFPMTVTVKSETRVLLINRELVFELCCLYPRFLKNFFAQISDQTVFLGTKIKHHVRRTIRECITAYLQQEYQKQNNTTIQLTMSKSALAEQMGVSRTSLSRELQKMKQAELIDYDRRSIRILDLKLLGICLND